MRRKTIELLQNCRKTPQNGNAISVIYKKARENDGL